LKLIKIEFIGSFFLLIGRILLNYLGFSIKEILVIFLLFVPFWMILCLILYFKERTGFSSMVMICVISNLALSKVAAIGISLLISLFYLKGLLEIFKLLLLIAYLIIFGVFSGWFCFLGPLHSLRWLQFEKGEVLISYRWLVALQIGFILLNTGILIF